MGLEEREDMAVESHASESTFAKAKAQTKAVFYINESVLGQPS